MTMTVGSGDLLGAIHFLTMNLLPETPPGFQRTVSMNQRPWALEAGYSQLRRLQAAPRFLNVLEP